MKRKMRIHNGLRDFFFFFFLFVTEVRLAGVNLFVAIPVQVKHKKINLPQRSIGYDASGELEKFMRLAWAVAKY